MRHPFRLLVLFPLAVLTMSTTACRTTAHVAIEVEEAGAGRVTVTVDLDADAAERVGDPERLRRDDLVAAGWEVTDPVIAEDGGLRIVGTKPFGSPDDLPGILEEVGAGVFIDTAIEIDDGFGVTRYRLATTVSLTGDPAQFSDAALTEALDGLPLGRTPEELAAEGATDPGAFTLEVEGRVVGASARLDAMSASAGTPTVATLEVAGEQREWLPVLLIAAGAVLVVAAAALVVLARRRG